MKERMMTVDFDAKASITFHGKNALLSKEYVLFSLEHQIASKGFIVGDQITRQDVGDFIYYHFLYFDGKVSRKIQIKIPKNDQSSIRSVDLIALRLNQKNLGVLENVTEMHL